MRILFVNDGVGDVGGVQEYLHAVARALGARGHALALLHVDQLRHPSDSPIGSSNPHFCTTTFGSAAAVDAALHWRPDVVFSHNMRALDVEQAVVARRPVVKLMHGYFGTCIGGQKIHAFPQRVVCGRRFGAACLAIYLPRHCGRWSAETMVSDYGWARQQNDLLGRYSRVMVASDYMRDEYVRHGVASDRVTVNPLFASNVPAHPEPAPREFRVLFLGRMTSLKGGDILIRAVALASETLGDQVAITLAGDGPSREAWITLSQSLGVQADFPGWVDADTRAALYARASVVSVPSVWPEPFGLTGLEGGAYGAASIAFDVGGIRTWLHDGDNGWLVNPRQGARGLARALVEARRDATALAHRRAGARRMAEQLSLSRHVDTVEHVLHAAAASEAT